MRTLLLIRNSLGNWWLSSQDLGYSPRWLSDPSQSKHFKFNILLIEARMLTIHFYISWWILINRSCINLFRNLRFSLAILPWWKRLSAPTDFKAGHHPLSCVWANARTTLAVVPIQSGISDSVQQQFCHMSMGIHTWANMQDYFIVNQDLDEIVEARTKD